jgi:Calpain family cysteine protease
MRMLGSQEAVYAKLLDGLSDGSHLFVASIDSVNGATEGDAGSGLLYGYAYSVLRACCTSQGHVLLQCRNPWGDTVSYNRVSPCFTSAIFQVRRKL